jgi:D-alanine-D-alanine ligase
VLKKINKHIEIVRSTNKELSSMSQESCSALYKMLSKYYARVGISTVNNRKDLIKLVSKKPDLAFIGMSSIPTIDNGDPRNSEKIWISKYLDENNILYTGSNFSAHMLESNKALAKQRILDHGLRTSSYFVARRGSKILDYGINMSFPMFVKPVDRGGGAGIDSLSVVNNIEELNYKVTQIADDYSSDSLVEEFLDGREFSVAILKKTEGNSYYIMPLELVAPKDEYGSRILSEAVKSLDTEKFLEIKDLKIKKEVSELAESIFESLGARDYGRIDIRLDGQGKANFLEANLIPSMIEGFGNFPKACFLNENLDYENMIHRIVDLAFARREPGYIVVEAPKLSFSI